MKTKRLELVQVPRPCSVSWDGMTGSDQARTCAVCGRDVHDLSAMTASEAERLLIERKDERLCIRFARGTDGRVMTADRPRPHYSRDSSRGRSIAGMSVAALAAFLGVAEPRATLAATPSTTQDTAHPRAQRTLNRDGSLSGIVLDPMGAGAQDATVVAINERDGEEFVTHPAADGRYRLVLPRGSYLVSVDTPGSFFVPFDVGGFSIGPGTVLNVTLQMRCMGECVNIVEEPALSKVLKAPARAVKKLLGK